MGRYGASAQRGTTLHGSANVFVENVLKTCARHCRPVSIPEPLGYGHGSSHHQPGPQIGSSFLPEWKAALPPALAENANAWRSLQRQVFQREHHQFRDAQSCCEAEVEHRTISNSEPSCETWRVEDGANFVPGEMPHERLVMAFPCDSVDLPRLFQGGGYPELDIPEEGLDCCEPSVARGRAVAALLLNVGEKLENQRGASLLQTDL